MGPWSYLGIVSGVVLMLSLLIRHKLHQIPELASTTLQEYDYIIVGGGTAGCVLASRLSEQADLTVLLLEAGADDRNHPSVSVPLKALELAHSSADWNYYTVPQKYALAAYVERRGWGLRGKLLGGSSNTNQMLYMRGLPEDYNQWERSGARGWNFTQLLPYFLRSEDNENADFVKTGFHKMGGPLKVGRSKTHGLTNSLMRAGREMGYSVVDINGGAGHEGFVEVQSTLRRGVRQSSSRAFLYPALHRDNLHVLANSLVTKVKIESGRAVGVVFEKSGTRQEVRARREVLLSAGAVGSAHLLMLSGVGPKSHLEKLKIPVVADLPVGENLQDGMMFDFPVAIQEPISINQERQDSVWEKMKYTLVGKGMLASPNGVEVVAYSHTQHNPHQAWPDLQLQFRGMLHGPKYGRMIGLNDQTVKELSHRVYNLTDGMACFSSVLRPESRGNILLASADPRVAPLINPNYLKEEKDVQVLIAGIDMCRRLLDMPSMKQIHAMYADGPSHSCSKFEFESANYWKCLVRARAQPVFSPVGTCKMGSAKDNTTVVDPQLRVKGVTNLRVVDSSIMPTMTSGGSHISTIMIAERASDLIKGRS